MRMRLVRFFVLLCVVLNNIPFRAFSAQDNMIIHMVVNDGEIRANSSANKTFGIYRAVDSEVLCDGLGGKQYGDNYVSCKTDSSNQTYVDFFLKNEDFKQKYTVYSYSIYGNKSRISFVGRYSSTVQPKFATISADSLLENGWNNIQFVFDKETLDTYYLLNGVKYSGKNIKKSLEGTAYANANTIVQLRLWFENYNAQIYYDDFSCYMSDTAPVKFEYGTITETDGIENSGNVIAVGDIPVSFTSEYNYKVMKKDSDKWTEASCVDVGDVIMVERPCVYGNKEYYKTYKYIRCVWADVHNEIAKKSDFLFNQGGSPLDLSGNTISDTRYDAKNVFGTDLTMDFVGVGVNNDKSCQSYYYTDWKKAQSHTEKYLVFEADFAFCVNATGIVPAGYVNLSTNGGTSLGTQIRPSKYSYRVNHYVWVYDVCKKIAFEYINGEKISDSYAVCDKFAEGTATAIRFGVTGYAENNSDKTKLYGGYIENVRLYECNSHPKIKQPLRAVGEKYGILPVCQNEITLGEVLNMFDDGEKIFLHKNRSYIPVTEVESSVSAGAGIIVTEKEGIYNYIRISLAPSDCAAYAAETIQKPSDGSLSINVVNLGDDTEFAPVIVRYKTDGSILDINYSQKLCSSGENLSVYAPKTTEKYTAKLFVWNGFSQVKPVDGSIYIN